MKKMDKGEIGMDHSNMYVTEEDGDKYVPGPEEKLMDFMKPVLPVDLGIDWQAYLHNVKGLGIITIYSERRSRLEEIIRDEFGYYRAPRHQIEEEGTEVMILIERKDPWGELILYYSLVPATIWRLDAEGDPELVQVYMFSPTLRRRFPKRDFLETIHISRIYLPRG